jgi:predicted phosphoribosyltransferase
MLKQHQGTDALVLAIPAGGVPVAVAFDGSVWIDQAAVETFGLKKTQIEKAVADAYEEWRDLSDDEVEAMLKP